MVIFLSIFKSYWKHILITIILISVCIYGYNKVYNIGYAAAQAECKQKLSEYEEKMFAYKASLDSRIKSLEDTSIQLVKETDEAKNSVKKDITKIITVFKDKPLIVIEKETCIPSADFISAYNQAVSRVNQ